MKFEGEFLLADTLAGGQAFRWRREGTAWAGEIAGRAARIDPVAGGIDVRVFPQDRARAVASFFRLDDDYESQLARLAEDTALAPSIEAYRGLRLLRQDPWVALASFIVSANNNVLRIEGILDRLAREAGETVEAPWGEATLFPDAPRVAALGIARLRAMGCGYRAPFLDATARAVAGGLDLARLRRAPLADAREALLDLPGVGPKVADCVLVFALDHTEAFPVDRHVARSVRRLWPRAPAKAARLSEWARRRWGRDAALAQQFVFHAERLSGRA